MQKFIIPMYRICTIVLLSNTLFHYSSLQAQCTQPTLTGIAILCFGQSITLTASPGYTAYAWSNGSTTQSTVITAPGPYQVTVTCSNGSTAIGGANVQAFTTGVAVVGGSANICAGQCAQLNVLLTNSGNTGPYTIVFELSTGGTQTFVQTGIGNLTTITVCPTVTTTYTLQSVTNSQGCVAFINPNLTSATVNVSTANITVQGPSTLCAGESATLTALPNNGTNYVWSNGATGNPITVNAAGTYSVTATLPGNCTGNGSINIAPAPSPSVSFVTQESSLCPNGCSTITANFTGNPPFVLNYSTPFGTFTQTFPANTGTFQVCAPAGAPAGTFQVNATRVVDALCTCE
jgi:hypothetical protein